MLLDRESNIETFAIFLLINYALTAYGMIISMDTLRDVGDFLGFPFHVPLNLVFSLVLLLLLPIARNLYLPSPNKSQIHRAIKRIRIIFFVLSAPAILYAILEVLPIDGHWPFFGESNNMLIVVTIVTTILLFQGAYVFSVVCDLPPSSVFHLTKPSEHTRLFLAALFIALQLLFFYSSIHLDDFDRISFSVTAVGVTASVFYLFYETKINIGDLMDEYLIREIENALGIMKNHIIIIDDPSRSYDSLPFVSGICNNRVTKSFWFLGTQFGLHGLVKKEVNMNVVLVEDFVNAPPTNIIFKGESKSFGTVCIREIRIDYSDSVFVIGISKANTYLGTLSMVNYRSAQYLLIVNPNSAGFQEWTSYISELNLHNVHVLLRAQRTSDITQCLTMAPFIKTISPEYIEGYLSTAKRVTLLAKSYLSQHTKDNLSILFIGDGKRMRFVIDGVFVSLAASGLHKRIDWYLLTTRNDVVSGAKQCMDFPNTPDWSDLSELRLPKDIGIAPVKRTLFWKFEISSHTPPPTAVFQIVQPSIFGPKSIRNIIEEFDPKIIVLSFDDVRINVYMFSKILPHLFNMQFDLIAAVSRNELDEIRAITATTINRIHHNLVTHQSISKNLLRSLGEGLHISEFLSYHIMGSLLQSFKFPPQYSIPLGKYILHINSLLHVHFVYCIEDLPGILSSMATSISNVIQQPSNYPTISPNHECISFHHIFAQNCIRSHYQTSSTHASHFVLSMSATFDRYNSFSKWSSLVFGYADLSPTLNNDETQYTSDALDLLTQSLNAQNRSGFCNLRMDCPISLNRSPKGVCLPNLQYEKKILSKICNCVTTIFASLNLTSSFKDITLNDLKLAIRRLRTKTNMPTNVINSINSAINAIDRAIHQLMTKSGNFSQVIVMLRTSSITLRKTVTLLNNLFRPMKRFAPLPHSAIIPSRYPLGTFRKLFSRHRSFRGSVVKNRYSLSKWNMPLINQIANNLLFIKILFENCPQFPHLNPIQGKPFATIRACLRNVPGATAFCLDALFRASFIHGTPNFPYDGKLLLSPNSGCIDFSYILSKEEPNLGSFHPINIEICGTYCKIEKIAYNDKEEHTVPIDISSVLESILITPSSDSPHWKRYAETLALFLGNAYESIEISLTNLVESFLIRKKRFDALCDRTACPIARRNMGVLILPDSLQMLADLEYCLSILSAYNQSLDQDYRTRLMKSLSKSEEYEIPKALLASEAENSNFRIFFQEWIQSILFSPNDATLLDQDRWEYLFKNDLFLGLAKFIRHILELLSANNRLGHLTPILFLERIDGIYQVCGPHYHSIPPHNNTQTTPFTPCSFCIYNKVSFYEHKHPLDSLDRLNSNNIISSIPTCILLLPVALKILYQLTDEPLRTNIFSKILPLLSNVQSETEIGQDFSTHLDRILSNLFGTYNLDDLFSNILRNYENSNNDSGNNFATTEPINTEIETILDDIQSHFLQNTIDPFSVNGEFHMLYPYNGIKSAKLAAVGSLFSDLHIYFWDSLQKSFDDAAIDSLEQTVADRSSKLYNRFMSGRMKYTDNHNSFLATIKSEVHHRLQSILTPSVFKREQHYFRLISGYLAVAEVYRFVPLIFGPIHDFVSIIAGDGNYGMTKYAKRITIDSLLDLYLSPLDV